jgi:hypothetical protein
LEREGTNLASITETAGNLAGKAVRGATKVAVGTAKWAGGELLSATLPGLPGFARSIHSTYTALTPSMPDGSAVGSGTSPNLRAGHHTTDTLSAQRMESLRLQVGQLVDQERQVGDRLLARLNILGEIRDAVPMLAAAGQPSANTAPNIDPRTKFAKTPGRLARAARFGLWGAAGAALLSLKKSTGPGSPDSWADVAEEGKLTPDEMNRSSLGYGGKVPGPFTNEGIRRSLVTPYGGLAGPENIYGGPTGTFESELAKLPQKFTDSPFGPYEPGAFNPSSDFLGDSPRSTNIEDRRNEPPLTVSTPPSPLGASARRSTRVAHLTIEAETTRLKAARVERRTAERRYGFTGAADGGDLSVTGSGAPAGISGDGITGTRSGSVMRDGISGSTSGGVSRDSITGITSGGVSRDSASGAEHGGLARDGSSSAHSGVDRSKGANWFREPMEHTPFVTPSLAGKAGTPAARMVGRPSGPFTSPGVGFGVPSSRAFGGPGGGGGLPGIGGAPGFGGVPGYEGPPGYGGGGGGGGGGGDRPFEGAPRSGWQQNVRTDEVGGKGETYELRGSDPRPVDSNPPAAHRSRPTSSCRGLQDLRKKWAAGSTAASSSRKFRRTPSCSSVPHTWSRARSASDRMSPSRSS